VEKVLGKENMGKKSPPTMTFLTSFAAQV